MESNLTKDGRLIIQTDLDVRKVLQTIANAESFEDNNELFEGLAPIVIERKKLEEALDQVKAIESEVKIKINDRAKVLMGEDWSAIKGQNYKFTRSKSGSVYEIVPEYDEDGNVIKAPADEFVKIEVKPNTDAIDKYRESKDELPECITLNQQRNDVIRMTVQL